MKQFFFVVLILSSLGGFAQKLLITPNDTIETVATIKPGLPTEVSAYVVNNTNAQILLKWKFVAYNGTQGYDFTMCDVYNCYAAGPQVREVDVDAGDSTFMKFGVIDNCVGGNAYGEFLLWIDGDSTASVRSLYYIVTLDNSECATSISDFAENGFSSYPNPVLDLLNVQFDAVSNNRQINIVDVAGKLMYSSVANAALNTFSLSALSSGSYFLRVMEHGKVTDRRRIAKH